MSRVELIGDATLYLGDCLEIMPGLAVDHVIGDPPYEASLHDSKNKLRERVRTDGGPDLKGLDFAAIDGIRQDVVDRAALITSGWFIAFCTVEGTWQWAAAINASPMKYKRACAWVKPDSTPQLNGQGPAQGYECFVTAWAGQGHARWNAGGKRGVYTHCVNTGRQGEHPTEKPVPLMMEILGDFTRPGDIVCDPFMGSGTTGVAATQLGRKFVGIEQNPKWFDLACRRIEAAHKQPRLFAEPPPKAVQGQMFA
jgi:site-specific DNA-methyltransferase (adenine-specific)